jgi:hypothetical protein
MGGPHKHGNANLQPTPAQFPEGKLKSGISQAPGSASRSWKTREKHLPPRGLRQATAARVLRLKKFARRVNNPLSGRV